MSQGMKRREQRSNQNDFEALDQKKHGAYAKKKIFELDTSVSLLPREQVMGMWPTEYIQKQDPVFLSKQWILFFRQKVDVEFFALSLFSPAHAGPVSAENTNLCTEALKFVVGRRKVHDCTNDSTCGAHIVYILVKKENGVVPPENVKRRSEIEQKDRDKVCKQKSPALSAAGKRKV